jgi:hypothetical protein
VHPSHVVSSADAGLDGERPSPSWQAVRALGVSDVVVAILEARKTREWATAARVSREQRGGQVYVRVTLLDDPEDKRSEVVAAFAADQLGDDLIQAFGPKTAITLK